MQRRKNPRCPGSEVGKPLVTGALAQCFTFMRKYTGLHCNLVFLADMDSKKEQNASAIDLATAKISDAQKLMGEARDLLRKNPGDVGDESETRELKEPLPKALHQVHVGSTVTLNVGGKIYKTTVDTLRKDPNSMLSVMFSGRHELKPDQDDGTYFIDRDGKLFRYILNYLRHGELLCPKDKEKELITEAKFYQVQGIIAQLEEKTCPFSSSLIIKNENHRSSVLSWFPPGATYSLLFRATDHRKPVDQFHRCCDNKGPTLVMIESDSYIFGGYTSKSWESTERLTARADDKSFLFTLVSPSGSESIKISPTAGAGGGIRCREDLGPSFGIKEMHDLQVVEGSFSSRYLECRQDLGNGYTCPRNADKEAFFSRKRRFDITELEVYKVGF